MSEGSFEAKVSAKRETNAGIFLTLQIQPDDYKSELATLRVGSALMLGWAEVLNTAVEAIEPAPQAAGGHARAASLTPAERSDIASKAATTRWDKTKEAKPFASLPLSQQAAIRCQDNDFKLFMDASNAEDAAEQVRTLCGIASRSELDDENDKRARHAWLDIEKNYQSWLTTQRYSSVAR